VLAAAGFGVAVPPSVSASGRAAPSATPSATSASPKLCACTPDDARAARDEEGHDVVGDLGPAQFPGFGQRRCLHVRRGADGLEADLRRIEAVHVPQRRRLDRHGSENREAREGGADGERTVRSSAWPKPRDRHQHDSSHG
jgi:hypothetical protein